MLSPQVHEQQPPAVQAWTRLLRAYSATARCLSRALLEEHGLTLNDYEALRLLAAADGRRLRRVDLADALSLSASGVTRLLEGLEEDGLVVRATCPHDRRVAYAELTDEGASRLEAASCGHVAAIEELLEESLSAAELEVLAGLLARIACDDASTAAGRR